MKRSLSKSTKNGVDDNVSEKLEKKMAPDLPVKLQPEETSQLEKTFHFEKKTQAEKKTAASPSVVVPWILNEVSECDVIDIFDPNVQMKVHAARLRDCWLAHGAQFPLEFARGLLQVLQGFNQDYGKCSGKRKRLACFLTTLFDKDNSPIYIRKGKEELWTLVLPELGRLELSRGKDWTSEEESRLREETACLLFEMTLHGGGGAVVKKGQQCTLCGDDMGREKSKMIIAIDDLKVKMRNVNIQAREERVKAQVKPAPWEVESTESENKD